MTSEELIQKLWDLYDEHHGVSYEVDSMRAQLRDIIETAEDEGVEWMASFSSKSGTLSTAP